MKVTHATVLLPLMFWPLTALVLGLDADWGRPWVGNSQWPSHLLAVALFFAVLLCGDPRRRTLLVIFVPLSAIGEWIFTQRFNLYGYRAGAVPLYVPFGHSIILGTGLMLGDWPVIKRNPTLIRRLVFLPYLAAVLTIGFFANDSLSLVMTLVLIALAARSRQLTMYMMIGLLVLYVELLGTIGGCWQWHGPAFGVLHATNPPLGAFVLYLMAELMAIKIARLIDTRLTRLQLKRHAPAAVACEAGIGDA